IRSCIAAAADPASPPIQRISKPAVGGPSEHGPHADVAFDVAEAQTQPIAGIDTNGAVQHARTLFEFDIAGHDEDFVGPPGTPTVARAALEPRLRTRVVRPRCDDDFQIDLAGNALDDPQDFAHGL